MSNFTIDPTVLNPDVYLNHLRPDEAREFEVSRNLYIAVLGAVACDILSFIPEDIRIIKRCNGMITTMCFALVRFSGLVYLSLVIALLTTPVTDCVGIHVVTGCLCLTTMAMTSFLFLRRVQAIYTGNRLVYWTFAMLWATTSSVVVALVPGTKPHLLPGTKYCIVYKAETYVPITNFMPAIFDTLVFVATSYKIAFQHNSTPGHKQNWARSWFATRTLPALSKAVLQGGQQYYLITFCLNIFVGAFAFSPLVPPMYRVLIATPAISISACLACRAHRTMVEAFYDHEKNATSPPLSTLRFVNTRPRSVIPQHITRGEIIAVESKQLV